MSYGGDAYGTLAYGEGAGEAVATYPDLVLADGATGYWRLNEVAGTTTVIDELGNHPGTYFDAAMPGQEGRVDSAAQFQSGMYATLSPDLPAIGTGDFTVEMWIKVPTYGTGTVGLFNIGNSASTDAISLFINATPVMYFRTSDAGTFTNTTVDATGIVDDVWHHLAFVREGGTRKIYLDGVLAASSVDGHDLAPAGDFHIGRYIYSTFANDWPVVGRLDEVAYYPLALTQAQIDAHIAAVPAVAQTVSTGFIDSTAAVYAPTVAVAPVEPLFIDSTAEVFAPSRVGQPYPVAVELTATDYTQAVDLESQTFGFKFTPTENITIKGFSAHMPAENGTNGINVEVRLWQAGPTLLHTAAIHAPGGSWPGQQWGKSDPVSIELTAGTTYAVAVTGVGGTGYYGYQGGAFRASVDARVGLISWSYGDSLTAYPATNYPSPYILGITGFSFEPALVSAQAITTPFVSSTSEVYALGVAPEQAVTSAFIASAEAIYAPTVAIASAALEYGIDTLPVLNTASEFGWTMGYAFTTTKVLTVQEVRVYVGTTGVHHVALWDAAGTKLAGVDVTVSLTGQWEQFEFPDVELAADAQYTISVFRSDTSIYHWSSDAPTVNPDIVYNGGRWTWAGNADAFPNSSDPTQLYGVADIAYLDVAAPPAAQDVSPGFIGSDAAIYAPTVVRIAPQDVAAPFITSSAEMYAPTVALEVPPEVATPFIDSAEEHYTATLVRQGAQDVLAPFISSTVEVFPTAIGAALFRVWDGSAYVEGQGQVWTEGGWALIKARHHYDGSSWVKV